LRALAGCTLLSSPHPKLKQLTKGITLNNAPQFSKKESPWRFLKLALCLRAPEPAFRHVLITLADHANRDGVCYPSYDLLLAETAYTSKQTITGALKYWKSAGVLKWKKGWGNSHKRKSNEYQFNEAAMEALIAQQKADRGNLTEDSDEISVGPDEISPGPDEISVTGGMKAHSAVAKVSALEGPINKTSQLCKEGGALISDKETEAGSRTAKQAHVQERSPDEISSESSGNGISSAPAAVTVSPTPTLAELHSRLTAENKNLWYKRTGGDPGAEGRRVALEILAKQGAA
jgi:hypothetical protein